MSIFGPISAYDIVYAAVAAIPLTFLITRMNNKTGKPTGTPRPGMPGSMAEQDPLPEGNRPAPPHIPSAEEETFLEHCREMFPLRELKFGNALFQSGDYIQLITLQQRLIEWQLIGRNDKNEICIRTRHNVIAQRVDRIERMRRAQPPAGF